MQRASCSREFAGGGSSYIYIVYLYSNTSNTDMKINIQILLVLSHLLSYKGIQSRYVSEYFCLSVNLLN